MKKSENKIAWSSRMKVVSYIGGEIPHKGDIVKVNHDTMSDDWVKNHTSPNKLYQVTYVDVYMDFDYREFFVVLNNKIEVAAIYLQLVIPYNFDYLVEIIEIGDKSIPVIFMIKKPT
ncbi:MAG: hypothetical protein DRP16_05405 [Candidatus Aenigmatarchaeota archaeon]|nr:MAG: hypothetical protein DRP16_05405 [Candidatus Aenigmarchaeota archaeon]